MASWTMRLVGLLALVVLWIGFERLRRGIAFRREQRRTGCAPPPMFPHKDPIFGYDLYRERRDALKGGYNMALYTRDFRRLGKTWQENALGKRVINTIDPVNHQFIHSIAMDSFGRQVRKRANASILGSGIFTADGEQWRHSRSIIKPIFARAEVGNMEFLAKHVDIFMAQLPRDGSTFDIQPMFKRLVLDLTTEFLLGEPFNAQAGDSRAVDFLKTFDEVMLGWNKRRQAGAMAFRFAFDEKWPAAVQRLYRYLDKHIEAALEKDSEEEELEKDEKERYILLLELVKQTRDPIQLRFELLNVFIPSRDTTAALFSNLLWILSRHLQVWADLRKCSESVIFDLQGPPALAIANLASLRPFRHVIYETLRTVGPSGRQYRVAKRNVVLPRGGGPDGTMPAYVPKDTVVCSVTHGIHHDPDIWGEDADEFRPERWAEAEDASSRKREPWTFVPFLGGPRVCPAQQQVMVQATYLLLRLVKEFERIECRDEVQEYIELQRMVIESRRGVQIALYVK